MADRANAYDIDGRRADWKARAAFDMAEEHRFGLRLAEARQWYREVIDLAPEVPRPGGAGAAA